MRIALVLAALLIPAAAQAQDQRLFISPMGEPFRGGPESEPESDWFKGVDKNGDGRLDVQEMRDDAERFFIVLDPDKSGEIDPREMTRYEGEIAPEVSLRIGGGMGRDPARDGYDSSATGTQPTPQFAYRSSQGAGLFSYFDSPQLVLSADTNFNRGVSAGEFQRAAERRFNMLDANKDGWLRPEELPTPRRSKPRKKRK
jgi:hypothetical protein